MSVESHSETPLTAGDRVLVGSRVVTVDEEFARSLEPGDRIVGVAATGQLRRISNSVASLVNECVGRSEGAFAELQTASDTAISDFYDSAASLMADDSVMATVLADNATDVAEAKRRSRSTTRLVLTDAMRASMIEALLMWRDLPIGRESVVETITHNGWEVEQVRSPLGIVAFVFEGRPNVFADATGVLRTGNSVVFRIGSDALNTARSLMRNVIAPALTKSGLPNDSVILVESAEHAAGWALFNDPRIALAVARGSGPAVAELGSIARQVGTPVSLHGTGGAWMLVGSVDDRRLADCVEHSLDRKVCNTLNTVCVLRSNASHQVPLIADAADRAAAKRGVHARVHCVNGAENFLDKDRQIVVHRTDGEHRETQVSVLLVDSLGDEFEWEVNPEFAIVLVDTMHEAIELFNAHSPHFVVSVVSSNANDHDVVWNGADAPFVGDGFTRWVDGQFALMRPELGLSNWQFGRLFGRGSVLSGDSVFTVRTRVRQSDSSMHR